MRDDLQLYRLRAVGVFVCLLGLIATDVAISAEPVEVPTVVGLAAAQAKQRIEAAGLKAAFEMGEPAASPEEAYRVAAQDPAAGARVDVDITVTVTLYDQAAVTVGGIGDAPLVKVRSEPFLDRSQEQVEPCSGRLTVTVTDIALTAGPVVLDVRRTWSSADTGAGLLGHRWHLNWEKRLVRTPEMAGVAEDGRIVPFLPDTDGRYWSSTGEQLSFEANRTVRSKLDGSTETFDAQGRLLECDLRNGNRATLVYDPQGWLSQIRGPFDAWLRFSVDASGRLTRVESSTGATVRYDYRPSEAGDGRADELGFRYGYTAAGELERTVHPLFGASEFSYDQRGHVTLRRFGNGEQEQYEYEELHGIQRCVDRFGRKSQVAWIADQRRMEFTDALGRKTAVVYDEASRPRELVDADSQVTRMSYDPRGRLLVAQDPSGSTSRREYLGSTNLPAMVTAADGRQTHFDYDARMNLVAVREDDRTANRMSFLDNGLLATIQPANEPEQRFTYDAAGRPIAIENKAGGQTELKYDPHGNLVSLIDPAGQERRWTYDRHDRLVRYEEPGGGGVSYEYGPRGELVQVKGPGDDAIRLQYDAAGQLIQVAGPTGVVARYEHDPRGRVVLSVEDGCETRFRYDEAGNMVDARQGDATWTYIYDALGRPTEQSGPQGYRCKLRYDAAGRVAETEDALGRRKVFSYDMQGRLAAVVDAAGSVQRLEYAPDGRLLAGVDSLGRRMELDYDAKGRMSGMSAGAQNLLKLRYDQGRLSQMTGPAGASVAFAYDAAGRRSGQAYANGETFSFKHDVLGRVTEASDALSHKAKAGYTPQNRLASLTTSSGDAYRYSYTPQGMVESVLDPRGHMRRFQYDRVGRLTKEVDPLGRETQIGYQWTPRGALQTLRHPDGKETRLQQDLLGRLAEIRYADGSSDRLQYDAAGNLVEEQKGPYHAWYQRDRLDRLVEARYLPANRTVRYQHDAAGRRTAMEVADIGRWEYRYDDQDRVTELIDPAHGASRFRYDASGRVVEQTLPNQLVVERSYDQRGRTLRCVAQDAKKKIVLARQYQYDAAGNLKVEIREEDARLEYQYDAEDRLVGWKGPGGEDRLSYDPAGNLMPTAGAEYDEADQVVRFAGERFAYDASGAMLVREKGTERIEYRYGPDRRLAAVQRNGQTVVEFGYDLQGRRIWKKAGQKTTRYVYDGQELLLELDDAGDALRVWVPGPELRRPVALVEAGKTWYPLTDALGSVVALTDDAGTVVARWEYAPFGELRKTAVAGSWQSPPGGFAGGFHDPETGLTLLGARYYDPRLGRFLTTDPLQGQLSNPASLHAYQYAFNNPLRYRDPDGATAEDIANAITSAGGRLGQMFGYGVGRATSAVAALPMTTYYWATGNTQASQRLNQASQQFAQQVTGRIFGGAASVATSVVTEPLRFGSGLGAASVNVQQGQYGAAALNTLADVGRGIPLVRGAMAAGQGSIGVVRVLNAPVTYPSGPADPRMAQAFINEAGSPGFQNMANLYAGIHGRTINWPQVMNQVRSATYQQMTPSEIIRTGGGFAGGGPGGSWVLSAWSGFGRIPIIGPLLQQQATRHELIHTIQDHLWGVFAAESAMGFSGRQIWELMPSLLGDPAIKLPGIAAVLATFYSGTGWVTNELPEILQTMINQGQTVGDQSAINSLVNALTASSPTQPTRPAAAGTSQPPPGSTAATGTSSPGSPAVSLPGDQGKVSVPSVLGMSLDAARAVLQKQNLSTSPVEGSASTSEAQSMQVYNQEPDAGVSVAINSSVQVWHFKKYAKPATPGTSPTDAKIAVPNVVGKTQEEARQELMALGFSPQGGEGKDKPPSKEKENRVYQQSPAAGTMQDKGQPVNFVFYSAATQTSPTTPPTVPPTAAAASDFTIPNVVGLTASDACARLAALNLTVDSVFLAETPPAGKIGTVKGQQPAGGTKGIAKEVVRLEIYGRVVPSVIGWRVETATDIASEAGMTVDKVALDRRPPTEDDAGRVYLQTPPGGEPIRADNKLMGIHAYSQWEGGSPPTQPPATPTSTTPATGPAIPPATGQGGFLPGDGALVDPRFAKAQVTNGGVDLGPEQRAAIDKFLQEHPSAGERSMLYFRERTGDVKEDNYGSLSLVIRRYISAENVRDSYQRIIKGVEDNKERQQEYWEDHILSKVVKPDGCVLHRYWRFQGYPVQPGDPVRSYNLTMRNEYCVKTLIYRDVFMIHYDENKTTRPAADQALGQGLEQVFDNAKKLIDLRFPSETNKPADAAGEKK